MSHPNRPASVASASLALCAAAAAAVVALWSAYAHGRRHGRSEAGRDLALELEASRTVVGDGGESATTSGGVVEGGESEGGGQCHATKDSGGRPPAAASPLTVHPIGTLRSVYRLCVGTPRQGMLAPHSRGIVTFDETRVSSDALLELGGYSHVYVVFAFHLNSNGRVVEATFGNGDSCSSKGGSNAKSNSNGTSNSSSRIKGQRQFPSKVAPPALGGKRVGVFATRTPHRPNPVGFSLCRLDRVIVEDNGKKKWAKEKRNKASGGGSTFSLLLSGLDLVDGTPVLDIKPYVPHYDCVGYNSSSTPPAAPLRGDVGRVPDWVDSGLRKRRRVTFLPAADRFLQDLWTNESALERSSKELRFYGPRSPWKDAAEEAPEKVRRCVLELLEADVRSAWQTRKARRGKFQAERSGRVGKCKANDGARESEVQLCTQQVDGLLVRYSIIEPGSAPSDERSEGSGAEDVVVVHTISFLSDD
ncbi:hypothetical protein ACHAWF_003386 [Thalassiosira exigua]